MSTAENASIGNSSSTPDLPSVEKPEARVSELDSEEQLVVKTSTDETAEFPPASVSLRRVIPSIGPRRISLRAGIPVHYHSSDNHT
jgi:hypothetical protein